MIDITTLGIALTIVIVLSTGVLLYQYWASMLADPLDELPPLDGDPIDEGWGKL